jgi:pyridoxine 5-phosphate synthase
VLLVPESRQEITTEGGLNVVGRRDDIAPAIQRLHEAGISISLFIDPDPRQIAAAKLVGADSVELHTGAYALAAPGDPRAKQLIHFRQACDLVRQHELHLHAGHGLTYANVRPIALTEGLVELNIGHTIVSRAVMIGMTQAVREMKSLVTTTAE